MHKFLFIFLLIAHCEAEDVLRVGGCLVYQLRRGSTPSPNIDASLKLVPKLTLQNGQQFQDIYSWAIPVLGYSFEEAEKVLPHPSEFNNRSIRLIVYPNDLPNIFINADNGHIDVFVNKTLLDFVEGTTAAFMIDVLRDRGDTGIEGIGFKKWLDDMRDLKGDPKSLYVPWPGTKNKDVKWIDQNVRAGTVIIYKFLMAHELSHLKLRKPSVAGPESLPTEVAVDRAAFGALLSEGDVMPNFIVNFEIAMWYYECLKGSAIRENMKLPDAAPPLLELAPARNWSIRAEEIVKDWEMASTAHPDSFYAKGAPTLIKYARDLIALPSPDPLSSASSRAENDAKAIRGPLLKIVKAAKGDFSDFRGALKETSEEGNQTFETPLAFPFGEDAEITVYKEDLTPTYSIYLIHGSKDEQASRERYSQMTNTIQTALSAEWHAKESIKGSKYSDSQRTTWNSRSTDVMIWISFRKNKREETYTLTLNVGR